MSIFSGFRINKPLVVYRFLKAWQIQIKMAKVKANVMNNIALEKLIQENRDSILDIAEKHGARNVRIFGSVARGEADQDSDIDFLVDMSSGHSLLDRIGLKQDLEDLLQCQVDVVTPKVLHEQIRDQVFQEAIVL